MKRNEILEFAMRCVCGDRERDYGTPEKNFELIGELWTTYLKEKCVSPEADVCINGKDVATLMCLLRLPALQRAEAKPIVLLTLPGTQLVPESWQREAAQNESFAAIPNEQSGKIGVESGNSEAGARAR